MFPDRPQIFLVRAGGGPHCNNSVNACKRQAKGLWYAWKWLKR